MSIYRWPVTMTASILNRITGGALYFGTLLVAFWLIAAAGTKESFDYVNWLFGTIIGRLILFGYTWALILHMLGGIRHFVWDTGAALEKHAASRIAWATLIGSVVLTLAVWVVGYMVRGGWA